MSTYSHTLKNGFYKVPGHDRSDNGAVSGQRYAPPAAAELH